MDPSNLKEIVLKRFQRFYGEGYWQWSRENVRKQLCPRNTVNPIDAPDIQQMLKELEAEGHIKLLGGDEIYLEVLKPKD